MPIHLPPEDGARQYEKTLRAALPSSDGHRPVFDLVLLGLGTDGHTASLFPGNPEHDPRQRDVIAVKGGNPELYRLTLTYGVINSARQVVFLVTGKAKSKVLGEILEGRGTGLPAGKIKPYTGRLTWILDQAAAIGLSSELRAR